MASTINNGPLTSTGVVFQDKTQGLPYYTFRVTDDGKGSTIIIETSNDAVTWVAASGGYNLATGTPTALSGNTITSKGRYHFATPNAYVRARVSTFVGGDVEIEGVGSADPAIPVSSKPLTAGDVASLTSPIPTNTVAALGSSTPARGIGLPGNGTVSRGGVGPMTWATILSGGRVWMPVENNFGVSGDTTVGMLTRLDALIAKKPGWAVNFPGANDISGGVSFATTIANTTTMLERQLNNGIRPVLVIPHPQNGTSANVTRGFMRFAEWCRRYASNQRGVVLVDAIDQLVDPLSSTYTTKASLIEADNIHLNNAGSFLQGQAIANALIAAGAPPRNILCRNNADRYDATNFPSGNLLTNGMFVGSNSGRSPNWLTFDNNATGLSTLSKDANDAQVITLGGTATTAGSLTSLYQDISPADLAGLVPGDTLVAACKVDVSATVGVLNVAVGVSITSGGVTYDWFDNVPEVASFGAVNAPWSGVLRTEDALVVGTPTQVRVRIRVYLADGTNLSPTGTIKVGAATLRRTNVI